MFRLVHSFSRHHERDEDVLANLFLRDMKMLWFVHSILMLREVRLYG
jgi:hypothetical protein